MKRYILLFIIAVCLILSGCKSEKVASGNAGITTRAVQEQQAAPICNCIGEQQCINGTCNEPDCAGCAFLDQATHTCGKYACCEDSSCAPEMKCSYHECVKVECGLCEYASGHSCAKYKCCGNPDCDDDDSSTDDSCDNPSTASARCIHESKGECGKDLSCFIDSLEECDESDVVLNLQPEDDDYEWDYNIMFTVNGKEDDDNCKITMEILNASVDMTDDYQDELETDGKTDEEIDDMLEDKEDEAAGYEGDDKTCSIAMDRLDNLADTLTSWEENDVFTIDEFNCDSLA